MTILSLSQNTETANMFQMELESRKYTTKLNDAVILLLSIEL